jgi:sugar phosphate isomerase/epimerase
MTIEFGVQSFCFRNTKDNAAVAGLVKEIGLDAIELCRIHVDFDNQAVYQSIIDAYASAGVKIISTGVNKINANPADRALFEFTKAAGCEYMSVNFSMANIDEELKSAEALAEEFDLKLGIHNHGGYHWLGTAEALAWVFSKSSKRVGLCLDTAWAMDAKQNPLEMVEKFSDRLYNVHFKDFTWNSDRSHNDVPVGTGNLDLPALLKTLDKVGFSGITVLEYEGDPENPVPALKECVANMKKCM